MRRWRAAHPEHARETRQRWRVVHRERLRKQARKRYRVNADHERKRVRQWREANLEYARKRSRQWRAANLDWAKNVCRKSARRWRKLHPGCITKQVRLWRQANPERAAQIKANRSAKVRGARGTHTVEEWKQLLFASSFRCRYCNCRLSYQNLGFPKAERATRDHVIPLKKGGSNDIWNIVPACGSCNSRKGIRHPATLSFRG